MTRILGKKYCISGMKTILFLTISAVLITYGMLSVQPISWELIRFLAKRANSVMLWMNFIPVLLLLFHFYFLTGQPVLTVSIMGALLMALSIANRSKLVLRGDPLLHWDLSLFFEAIKTVQGFDAHIIVLGAIGILAFCFVVVFCCMKWKAAPIGWKARTYGVVLSLGIVLLSFDGLYGNDEVYKSLPVYGDFYNMADVFNSRGFFYSFLYTLNTQRKNDTLPKDAKAVSHAVAGMPQRDAQSLQNGYRPNIIMIMGESFSDLSQSEAFDFSGHQNPLQNYLKMGEDGISGRLVVPSRGGGTADTEFDVLTGNVSRYLRNASYSYRLLTRPTEAIPSILSKIGYQTFALHPGYRWFYNRQNVYPNLGFSQMVFEDAFSKDAYLDLYISEVATYDMLLSLLDEYLPKEEPFFAFCLTIQNHAGYEKRFLPEGTVNFQANIPLSEEEENNLSNYFAGITDADKQLARLMDFLNEQQEPILLVYFGDHMPALPNTLYQRIVPGENFPDNSIEKETWLHQTPFILWQNDAAKVENDLLSGRKDKDTGTIMSSNYFGAYLLEVLGFEGISPFFDFVNTLRPSVPILLEQISFPADGEGMFDLPPPLDSQLTLYKAWIRRQVYSD